MDGAVALQLRKLRVLWLALLPSNFVFVAIVGLRAQPASAEVATMTLVMVPLAATVAVLSFVLPARLFAIAIGAMRIDVEEQPGEALGGFRQAALVTRRVARPSEIVRGALLRWQTSFILGMGLAESVGLLGFVLGFLGARREAWLPLVGASVAIMLVKLPRLETVTSAIERASGAKLTL